MKVLISLVTIGVGLSAFAAPPATTPVAPVVVAPVLQSAKVHKVYPDAALLQRGGANATVGMKVQVGISNGCRSFAGYYFEGGEQGPGIVAVKKTLNFATTMKSFPMQMCTQIYRLQDVVVPIMLQRGDEASSAGSLFNVAGVGTFNVSFDWSTGQAKVSQVMTLE